MDKEQKLRREIKGEAIISMWAILEILLVMSLMFIILDLFGISLLDVWNVYGGHMFTLLNEALTGLFEFIADFLVGIATSVASFITNTFCSATPFCL